jgi:hypothetical protein
MSTLSSVPEEELRNKIDTAIQDHLIIGVDSGQAYFQETDFVIDNIVALINQQIKSVFDELESELDDGKNSHSMKVISSAIQKIRSRYE